MTSPSTTTTGATELDASTGPLANRDFRIVLAGQAVSALGDAISLTAMPLLVLSLTGSAALMGVVGALELLPWLVLGLPAGALADRWDRRRMMQVADAGQAVLTAMVPLSLVMGGPTVTVILIVVVPIHVLRVLGTAGFMSVIPGLVGRQHIGRANSYLEAALTGSFIVGPAIAGLLMATIGPAPTLAIDATSFAFSAASLSLIRRPLRAERQAKRPRIVTDIMEGLRFVWGKIALRMIVAYWGVMAVATAALLPALTCYITIDRRFGPELFGFVGSAWSAGYLVGSVLASRLGDRRIGARMLVCGAAIGASLFPIALSDVAAVYLVAAFVVGGALSIVIVSCATLRAAVTPDELLGRVGATTRTITLGLQPFGMVAGGALIAVTNGGAGLMTMGAVAIAASLVFGLSQSLRDAGNDPVAGPVLSVTAAEAAS